MIEDYILSIFFIGWFWFIAITFLFYYRKEKDRYIKSDQIVYGWFIRILFIIGIIGFIYNLPTN